MVRPKAILLSVAILLALSACAEAPVGSSTEPSSEIKSDVPETSIASSPLGSDPDDTPEASAPPSRPIHAAKAARQNAIDACITLRDNMKLAFDKVVAGQNQAAALAAKAATFDSQWQSFSADMSTLALAPLPSPGAADSDWNAHLNAYFVVADKDCTPLGIELPN